MDQPHRYELHVTTECPAAVEGRHELRPVAPVPAERLRGGERRTGPMPYLRACARRLRLAPAPPHRRSSIHPVRDAWQGMSGARKPAGSARGSGGRAARMVEHGAAALLEIHVARSLYVRWRRLGRRRPRAPRAARRGRQASRPGPARHDGSPHGRRELQAPTRRSRRAWSSWRRPIRRSPRSRCATFGRTWRGAGAAHDGGHQGIEGRGARYFRVGCRAARRRGAEAPESLHRSGAALDEPIGEASAHLGRAGRGTLEFRDATKLYPGQDEPAVDGLTLEVPAGEICVLVGPSGCGKTTAMRMVNRMIDITSGDIRLDGR